MARIWLRRSREGYCVTVAGHLAAADLRRLERACGPALEQRHVALQLDLTAVTASDPVANAFLDRLTQRGARIRDRSARKQEGAPRWPSISERGDDG